MNNNISLTITGDPIAKQRSRRGAHGNWYNPQEELMQKTMRDIKNQLPKGFNVIEKGNPVRCELICFFSFPKKVSAKIKTKEKDDIICLNKKDIDNILKYFFDCMNKIVWYDDNQVYSTNVEKYYSMNPRTEINISW
jgi:Holliday junction resolvase RusA-like endonuclease